MKKIRTDRRGQPLEASGEMKGADDRRWQMLSAAPLPAMPLACFKKAYPDQRLPFSKDSQPHPLICPHRSTNIDHRRTWNRQGAGRRGPLDP